MLKRLGRDKRSGLFRLFDCDEEKKFNDVDTRRSSILEGSGYCMYGLGSLTHGGKSLTSPSPVFNMRYKSMTNLATSGVNGSNEYDTLDSSGSGGKTISGDSGGGSSSRNQLPEKRSRKLSRPKSLTNLVKIFIKKTFYLCR
jgi:hypothetical protein